MKTYPLRVFVKRVLLIRLAIVAIGAALIGGAATFFLKQQELQKQVVDLGRHAVSILMVARYFSAGMESLRYGKADGALSSQH